MDSLRQIIIVRRDLLQLPKWNLGSVIAQACHASIDCLAKFKQDPNVIAYLMDADRPRMTTIILEAADEHQLKQCAVDLSQAGLDFSLWNEMPENMPTALAIKPYHKSNLPLFLKSFKLFK